MIFTNQHNQPTWTWGPPPGHGPSAWRGLLLLRPSAKGRLATCRSGCPNGASAQQTLRKLVESSRVTLGISNDNISYWRLQDLCAFSLMFFNYELYIGGKRRILPLLETLRITWQPGHPRHRCTSTFELSSSKDRVHGIGMAMAGRWSNTRGGIFRQAMYDYSYYKRVSMSWYVIDDICLNRQIVHKLCRQNPWEWVQKCVGLDVALARPCYHLPYFFW